MRADISARFGSITDRPFPWRQVVRLQDGRSVIAHPFAPFRGKLSAQSVLRFDGLGKNRKDASNQEARAK
jgi:hypothetical protein